MKGLAVNTLERLRELSSEIFDLQNISALLSWDQEVNMPRGAVADRASQIARISTLIHAKQTAQELVALLDATQHESNTLSEYDRALVRVMRRTTDHALKLPADFVQAFSQLTSESVHAWAEARAQSNFSIFEPHLERIVSMTRQQADYLGYSGHPYDALLDLYEEGFTTAEVDHVFSEIKNPLIALLKEARDIWNYSLVPHAPIPVAEQQLFVRDLVATIGYDFQRGRMDIAPHPFMERFGHDDRRITNRYCESDITGALFGSLHEAGHALYEQGIGSYIARTALDTGVSLGMHESQSRMWENIIGRSLPFWEFYFPRIQEAFPLQFAHLSLTDFYAGVNHVTSSYIRTESDEISYNVHILIRFEIEKALIEGSVRVHDLPELWNQKYSDYLNLTVPDDAHGILQDIHWSHGAIGYFPTYTLGNLISCQIWNSYTRYDPHYEDTLRSGNFSQIREWLTEHMYTYGSIYPPRDLLARITDEPLQSAPLIAYLQTKYLRAS